MGNKQENQNKPMPIRTFPPSLDNASKIPQMKMDKSPDVIPHSTGTNQTSTPLNKVGKEKNVNSHYANTNPQPSDPRLQGISALRGSRIGGATIVNQNFENSIPSLGSEI